MIDALKPYADYKESGVSWLGKIPAEWETKAFRAIATVKKGKQPARLVGADERAADDLPYLSMDFIRSPKPTAEFFAKYQPNLVKGSEGDIILLWDGSNAGEFMQAKYGIVSSTSALIITQVINNRFLFYACKLAEPTLRSFTVGMGIPHVDSNVLKNIRFSIPPSDEQAAIVRFLDHANRKIERFIRIKRRLIELLNEQKQAIIHQAVTRGLDPNFRLKPSGIDWIGDVPEHWEVSRLYRLITLQRGFDITKEQQIDGSIPVVSSGGISSFHNKFTSIGPGVIVGRKGTVGAVYFIQSDYWAHDTTLFVKEFNGNHPKFIYYLLKQLNLKRFDTGSANPTLNRNVVHPERVPFPPVNEQRAIASFLDQQSEQIEGSISNFLRHINLLREYRTRLISDVVTGKLDVRGVELPAMDEAETLGDIDTVEDTEPESEELLESEEVANADE